MPALLSAPGDGPFGLDGPLWLALSLALSYLVGAIPFGWAMARVLRGVDIRTLGSGNIGAANAMRALGRPLGLVAFLLDFAKGWAPVHLVGLLGAGDTGLQVACGAAAVCGHVWPIYLGFRGGKAVATGCGGLLAIDPLVFLGGGLTWLGTLLTTRYVGLSSIVMGLCFPLLATWRRLEGKGGWELVAGTGGLALLIVVRHRSNIARMIAGEEPRAKLMRRGEEEA